MNSSKSFERIAKNFMQQFRQATGGEFAIATGAFPVKLKLEGMSDSKATATSHKNYNYFKVYGSGNFALNFSTDKEGKIIASEVQHKLGIDHAPHERIAGCAYNHGSEEVDPAKKDKFFEKGHRACDKLTESIISQVEKALPTLEKVETKAEKRVFKTSAKTKEGKSWAEIIAEKTKGLEAVLPSMTPLEQMRRMGALRQEIAREQGKSVSTVGKYLRNKDFGVASSIFVADPKKIQKGTSIRTV